MTIIKGVVTDELTGDPMPFVSVFLKGTTVGTLTDSTGKFRIETRLTAKSIVFSFLGYVTVFRTIIPGKDQTLSVKLMQNSIKLNDVYVRPEKNTYKNKGNPAVELIEKVIDNKAKNREDAFDYLEYQKYEKIQFALSNIPEKYKHRNPFGRFNFIFDNIDTTKRVAKNVLPLFIKESLSDHYYRKTPEATKDIIIGEKSVNLDEYLNNKGVSAYLNYLYQNINIYDNEILFLTNKFLSPIAESAPLFYRYFIIDTLSVKDVDCIRLFFEPRNQSDFLFHGYLYITLDSSYAVRKIDMGINKNINIDWVRDISITQDFENFGKNKWLISKDEISIDFGVFKKFLGLYGQRTIYYKDYKIDEPIDDKIFQGPEKSDKIDPLSGSPGFWESNRAVPLTKSENKIYTSIDSLRQLPQFRRRMDIVMMLTAGFLKLNKIEIGPVSSFLSFNSVEGTRLRFGGRTSTDFSKKVFLDGYLAYGLNDKILKYNAGVTYSLTSGTIYQFPVKSIRLSYQKDTRIPGQELQFFQADNLFLSFKRGVSDKMLLNNTYYHSIS